MPEDTATATAPEPVVGEPAPVIDPLLQETLATLDRDISGEMKFCHNALEALRAFQARWSTDNAVTDGYGQAMKALENMNSILTGAQARTTENVTRTVLGRKEAAMNAAKADVAREHATAWAEQPMPQPETTAQGPDDRERRERERRERERLERETRERQERERLERETRARQEQDQERERQHREEAERQHRTESTPYTPPQRPA